MRVTVLQGQRRVLQDDGAPLSNGEVARGLVEDPAVADALTDHLTALPHAAIFWECAPCSAATRARPFEFTVNDSPTLARVRSDPSPFSEQLRGDGPVATFDNLSGDARLIAPRPASAADRYPHLLAFLRSAPSDQRRALWAAAGQQLEAWWAARSEPVWLSTSGLGVHWLHLRLDRRPKYYTTARYRTWPPAGS